MLSLLEYGFLLYKNECYKPFLDKVGEKYTKIVRYEHEKLLKWLFNK